MTLSVCFLIHLEACAIFFRKLSGTGIKINLIKLWWWPLAHVLCKWEEADSTPTFLCVQPSNYHFSLITCRPLGLQYHRLSPHARTSNLFFKPLSPPTPNQDISFIIFISPPASWFQDLLQKDGSTTPPEPAFTKLLLILSTLQIGTCRQGLSQ